MQGEGTTALNSSTLITFDPVTVLWFYELRSPEEAVPQEQKINSIDLADSHLPLGSDLDTSTYTTCFRECSSKSLDFAFMHWHRSYLLSIHVC